MNPWAVADADCSFWKPKWVGIVAVAVGVALRLFALSDQVLGDDEFHAVRAALELSLPEILVTYRLQDHSIPLTALYRIAMDAGLPMGELAFRAPVLACGLLLLVALPGWLERRRGAWTGVTYAWLLALSPMLFFYSRIVRSYLPIALIGAVAVRCFYAYWEAGRRAGGVDSDGGGRLRNGLAYCGLAVLAIWFHLGATPFVLSPLVFAFGAACLPAGRQERMRELRELCLVAGGVGLGCVAFAWPARDSLLALVEAKRSLGFTLELAPALETLALHAGTRAVVLVGIFWGAAALGLRRLWITDRCFASYTAVLVVGHVAGLIALSPDFHSVILLARWTLIALPIVLLWVAVGLQPSARWRNKSGSAPVLRASLPAAFVVLIFATGPFASGSFWRSSFQHHYDLMRFTAPEATVASSSMPEAYRELVAQAPGAVLEYPWHPFWGFSRSAYAYQGQHGRRVLVSNDEAFARDKRLRWRNFAALDAAALLASDARFLLVHLDLPREEAQMRRSMGEAGIIAPMPERFAVLRTMGRRGAARLRAHFGPPESESESILVWDLERLRRAASRRSQGD